MGWAENGYSAEFFCMTHISEISPDMPQIEGLDTKRIYILTIGWSNH